ncbi:MAG: hypothetical protein M3Z27_05805 [Actinomycetota bacterium]|nr:hypothetical protein [Actinomycetota bacterium]
MKLRRHPLPLILTVAFVGLLAAPAAPARTHAPAASPTRAQIRKAVRAAEHSRDLWATVNVCGGVRYPNVIGIRGQIPALGFPATLRMLFEIDYWDYNQRRFRPLTGVVQPVALENATRGTYQAGVRFKFQPHTELLRGRVGFQWRVGSRTIGSAERLTRQGHGSARYSDPSGFSDWKCVIR